MDKYDLIICGYGLSGALTAKLVSEKTTEPRVLILDQSAQSPDKTWSFHGTDLPLEWERRFPWLKQSMGGSWPSQRVYFPNRSRDLRTSYHSIRSSDFYEILENQRKYQFIADVAVESLSDTKVVCKGGMSFEASVVLDARGFESSLPKDHFGFQKFLGLDVECEKPHGITEPVIMDACVDQKEGYRFIYLLPWTEKKLLVEDTRYSLDKNLYTEDFEESILKYLESLGITQFKELRRECSALPIPLSVAGLKPASELSIGMRGGFFHPVTGYSFPLGLELAISIASLPKLEKSKVRQLLAQKRSSLAARNRFYCYLNRMLFHGTQPGLEYKMLAHFYAKSEKMIRRFYSSRSNIGDLMRILFLGKPPIPVSNALRQLSFNQESSH